MPVTSAAERLSRYNVSEAKAALKERRAPVQAQAVNPVERQDLVERSRFLKRKTTHYEPAVPTGLGVGLKTSFFLRPPLSEEEAIEAVAKARAANRPRHWDPVLRTWYAEPPVDRSVPRRNTRRLYRMEDKAPDAQLYNVLDVTTGVRLGQVRGDFHWCLREALRLAKSQGGGLKDVRIREVE